MSIFDGDQAPWNLPFPTNGGKVFWEDLECRGEYTLQRNLFDGHCRIINEENIRVAWGNEGQMRAKLQELTTSIRNRRAKYGDVIGVHRSGGLYDHYGVYESDSCVYEYAAKGGDFGSEIEIHCTTLDLFVRDSGTYFVLTFPEEYGLPGKLPIPAVGASATQQGVIGNILRHLGELCSSDEYHLYSPEETIRRAQSRLGEKAYDLVTNNCEHYAIWCKTGMRKSHQVDAVLNAIRIGQETIPSILEMVNEGGIF